MSRWLLALALCLASSLALAQGCGPTNPNCIVPDRPLGDISNAAANTRFVAQNATPAVSVVGFGAKCDGSTNDFVAIQTAINAGSGTRVVFPAGTCTAVLPSATSLATLGANTIIEGLGKNTSVLKLSLTGTSFATAFSLSNSHVIFRNITIQLNGDSTGTQNGILFGLLASDLKFQNVSLTSNAVEGVLIGGTATNADTVKVIFTSSALAGSPITITSTVSGGQTAAQIATGLATAINANGTISGAGIVATATGSFVSIAQPDTLVPQASYTTQVTGAATETMTIGPSVTSIVWNIPQTSAEVSDFLAENAEVSGWNYSLLKANATTTTNRRFVFRGGFYNQIITGAANINSPAGIFDRLVIEGLHIGQVGLNSTNDLPVSLSNVTNATIIGNVLEGTYDANAMHFEENSSGLTVSGNVVQQATSTGLGAGFAGSCMFMIDNNVGGGGFKANNDVTITGNTCRTANTNQSGYGIFGGVTSVVNQRWTIASNVLSGYAGGVNLAAGGFSLVGNSFVNFTAAGTGITIAGTATAGIVSDNTVRTYTTEFANSGTGIEGIPATFTPALTCGTATFTTSSARFKTLRHTTQAALDFTITAIGTCGNLISFTLPNTANSAAAVNGREVALNGKGMSCTATVAGGTASCSKADNSVFLVNERFNVSGIYENQ